MANSNINTGVNSLLTAAKYVREETLINGNQAAQLDSLINSVVELTAHVNEYTARIADRIANGLNVERLQRWVESAKAKLTAAVESLREWLKAFKANRPNVAINIEDDEESTPENDATINEANNNAQEHTHAAHCLSLYLNKTSEIYNRFTVPAIDRIAKAYKAGEMVCTDPEHFAKDVQEITPALQAAARLVQKYDGVTPTQKDIEAVKTDYVAYIIECAQYQVNND